MNNKGTLLITYLRATALFMAILGLTGCIQSEKEDLQQFVDQVMAKEKSPIAPIPEVKIHQNFSYAASELRDPFKATVVEVQNLIEVEQGVTDNGVGPDAHRLKEALESYNLNDLQLVGILEQGRRSAMVRAPDGVVHLVNVGNFIGENNGKILVITDSTLTIREIVAGEKFAWVERENALSLE